MFEKGTPYIAPKTCVFCGKTAEATIVHESGIEYHVCKRHLNIVDENQKWKVKHTTEGQHL